MVSAVTFKASIAAIFDRRNIALLVTEFCLCSQDVPMSISDGEMLLFSGTEMFHN